jgi:putative ABC transport system permease protein
MRSIIAFSFRALRRDWRAGELRIVAAALVIAVGGLTAVGFFTDRVEQAMNLQAAELLAADMVLASSEPLRTDVINHARVDDLQTARTLSFRSVALSGDKMQLVEVKAVSEGYPLRGSLRVAPEPFTVDALTHSIPAHGQMWVSASLLQELGVRVGDAIKLGEASFVIAKILTYEPDRGGDLFVIAPRVLMSIEDVPTTRLLQAGSRASYRLLVAGKPTSVARFRRWLTPRLAVDEHLLTLDEGRPELRAALDRARLFLGLAAMVSVLLSGLAIAMAAHRYAQRHLDASAIMRCLGATQRIIIAGFACELLWLGLAASLIGCAFGYGAQEVLAKILTGLMTVVLPAPGPRPLLIGLPVGMIMLAGFALPPLLALQHVPPTRVLRRDVGVRSSSGLLTYGVATLTMLALLAWQVREFKLFMWVAAGTLATLLALTLVAMVLVRLTGRLRTRVGVAWRFGLANIARRAHVSVAQLVAFGIGITVLLLLSIVRGDLLEGWRRTIPADAPNYFLVNIQPDQVASVRGFLAAHGISAPQLLPMVRGRLVAINGVPLRPESFADPRARRLARREFNLSWAGELQSDNRIVAGRWWARAQHGQALVSFERGLAATLGIKLGDELKYNVAGTPLVLRVSSLRSVDWDSFHVNFFAIVPPGVLDGYPVTYITSFFLSPERRAMLTTLVKTFPNVTVVDVDALIAKVRLIMDRVSMAVQYVFLFTLLAGLAVLYASIQATQDERRYESAILRTLGARRPQLLYGLLAEFTALGMLAGTLAGFAATVLGYLLADHVFHFGYRFDPWIWLLGWAGGALGIGIAGTLGARRALRQPPVKTLREV